MEINPSDKAGSNQNDPGMEQPVYERELYEREQIKVHESESDEQDKKIAETMLNVEEIEY